MTPEIRQAILAKDKNHVWGRDGFCVNCHNIHRTDMRQNDLCAPLMKTWVFCLQFFPRPNGGLAVAVVDPHNLNPTISNAAMRYDTEHDGATAMLKALEVQGVNGFFSSCDHLLKL